MQPNNSAYKTHKITYIIILEDINMDILDNVLEKAKAIAGMARKKTGKVVEISKIKLDSLQTNSEIKACYEKLGNAVYSMAKADYENPELIANIIEEIDELIEHLDDNHDKISNIRTYRTCECCDSRNPLDAVFCSKCGNKLEDVQDDDSIEITAETVEE